MATRDNVNADVLNLLGTDPNISTAELNTIIQLRYESVYESWTWSRRLRDFTLTLVASTSSTSTTTVTATLASSTITSAGTPFTSGMAGRQIQVGSEPHYFFVNSFTSTAALVLGDGEGSAVTWPRATDTAATWTVFQSIYTLPSDADSVISLSGANFEVDELDGGRSALDEIDPTRSTTAAHPTHWVYAGENSSSVREIEVWPVPTSAALLRGQYSRRAPTLAASTEIGMPRSVLVYAVMADACNMLFHKTGDTVWGDRAVFYERKYGDDEKRFRFMDLERLSPARSLGHHRRLGGFRGTDFEATHDMDALDL